MSENSSEREILRRALAPGKDCPPIEKLERCLDSDTAPLDLARHLESCAYCRAELDLLRLFQAGPRDEADFHAARLVAERLRSPLPGAGDAVAARPDAGKRWWKGLLDMRWLSPAALAAAGILIAVAVGLQWRGGTPGIHAPDASQREVLRSGAVNVIAPIGDVQKTPERIQWRPVAAAVQYQVRLLEVDRTELWKAIASEPRVGVPAQVQARIVPSKTLLLQVTAFDGGGHKVAESEFVSFRFLPGR